MLNAPENLSSWQLSALIFHTYNLKNGLKCTGFDQDDAASSDAIVLLPDTFVANSSDMVTFRYTQPAGYDIIMTFIPSSDFKSLDINSMCSDQDGAIFSATVNIGHLDLAAGDKAKLDNLDSWAIPELVNDAYVKEVFDKVTRKEADKK